MAGKGKDHGGQKGHGKGKGKGKGSSAHVGVLSSGSGLLSLVAEWIHFTLLGVILPTIELKVYTFWVL